MAKEKLFQQKIVQQMAMVMADICLNLFYLAMAVKHTWSLLLLQPGDGSRDVFIVWRWSTRGLGWIFYKTQLYDISSNI